MTVLSVVAALAAAQGAQVPLAHRVEVPVAGRAVPVDYAARIAVATDQRGIAPPGRTSSERCHWQATLAVERSIADGRALRPVASDWTAHGSVPGNCALADDMIDRELAARLEAAQAALVASAEADRTILLAELAALDQIAADD